MQSDTVVKPPCLESPQDKARREAAPRARLTTRKWILLYGAHGGGGREKGPWSIHYHPWKTMSPCSTAYGVAGDT